MTEEDPNSSSQIPQCWFCIRTIRKAKVVTDRAHGYSKGSGFVRYATLEDANKGIEGMDGKFLDGWVIFAEYARPRDAPVPGSGPGQSVPRTGY